MKSQGMIVVVLGAVFAIIGVFWGRVIGFYESERFIVYGLVGAGLILIFVGSRMVASTKSTKVEWRPSEPLAPTPEAVNSALSDAPTAVTVNDPQQRATATGESKAADRIDDATVAVPRRRRSVHWTLELPDGSLVVVREQTLLGRAPQPTDEHPRADLIVIDDPSVSKSHALMRLADGALQVLDLTSANGTVLIVGEIERVCAPGIWMLVPDGATLELGTAEVRCTLGTKREVAP